MLRLTCLEQGEQFQFIIKTKIIGRLGTLIMFASMVVHLKAIVVAICGLHLGATSICEILEREL